MQKIIEFEDKVALNENSSIPETNKITDDNINEIKSIVNGSLQGTNAMGSIVVDDVSCKNMFNKNSDISSGKYYNDTTGAITTTTSANNYLQETYIEVQPNTTYTASAVSGSTFIRLVEYTNDKTYIKTNTSGTSNTITITTGSTTQYIRMSMVGADVLDTLQLELGSTPTTYTPYKAFDNQEVYSFGERKIGTWIDGKPIYRKVFDGTTASSGVSTSLANNVDYIIGQGGFILIPGGYAAPLPYIDTSNNYAMVMLNRGTHELYIYHSTSYVSRNYTVWVDYTKTTSGTRNIETEEENNDNR